MKNSNRLLALGSISLIFALILSYLLHIDHPASSIIENILLIGSMMLNVSGLVVACMMKTPMEA